MRECLVCVCLCAWSTDIMLSYPYFTVLFAFCLTLCTAPHHPWSLSFSSSYHSFHPPHLTPSHSSSYSYWSSPSYLYPYLRTNHRFFIQLIHFRLNIDILIIHVFYLLKMKLRIDPILLHSCWLLVRTVRTMLTQLYDMIFPVPVLIHWHAFIFFKYICICMFYSNSFLFI